MLEKLLKLRTALHEKSQSNKAFTLIELIIVIVIIAVLVAIAMPDFVSTLGNSKISSAESNIKTIGDATMQYTSEMGHTPEAASIDELKDVLTQKEEDNRGFEKGPWLKKNMSLQDPWGNDYEYEPEGDNMNFDIISHGPNGDDSTQIRYSTLGNKNADKKAERN